MDFNFFSQADHACFELEKARRTLEAAKLQLDSAKLAFEDVMNRAEENGVSKPKLRKLVEERVASIFESGLAENPITSSSLLKAPSKAAKKSNKKAGILTENESSQILADATDELSSDELTDSSDSEVADLDLKLNSEGKSELRQENSRSLQ